MCDTMRREFYLPQMANGVYVNIRDFYLCARNRNTNSNKQKPRLFPPFGTLEYIAMGILGLLPRTKYGDQFIVVMMDRY